MPETESYASVVADPQKEVPQDAPWVLIARAEGEDSFYPEDERITPEMLKAMARAFDPTFRRVYVVCGWEKETETAGGGHWQGEYNRPVGEVVALRTRSGGQELEAKFEEFLNGDDEPAITSLVRSGFQERSIRWWPHTPELKGHPPYLRHVALLGAEPPGIHSMPCLDEYFRTPTEVLPGLQEWVRGSSLTAPTMERSLSEAKTRTTRTVQPVPQEDAEMTPEEQKEEIRTQVAAGIAAAIGGLPEAIRTALASALPDALKATNDGLAEIRALATDAKKAADDTKSAVDEVRAAATSASIDRRIDALKTSGRVTPADAESFGEMLRDLPADKAEAQLVKLEGRSPQTSRRATAIPATSPEVAALGDASRYLPPDGGNIDPVNAAILVRAKAEAAKAGAEGSEPYKIAFAAAAYQISAEMEN